jgi:hypothetical protein
MKRQHRFRWLRGMAWVLVVGCLLLIAGPAAAVDEAMLKRMEELIQKQQAQIEAQARAIEQLQKQVGTMTETAVEEAKEAAKAEVARTGTAPDAVTNKLGGKVTVQVYGQVNKAFLASDDGNTSDHYFVDNDNSSSRLGLLGDSRVNEDITIGSRFEFEYQDNPSNVVNQSNKSSSGSLTSRWVDAQITSKRFGKAYLGKGSTASDNSSEVDLSGTSVVGYASIADMAGGQRFYDTDTNTLSGVTIGNVFSDFDGLGRQTRLRYDTPNFAGFYLAGSLDDEGAKDAALNYAAKWGESFKFAAAVAYADPQKTIANVDKQYNGSASILHSSGLNFTLAGGLRDYEDTDRNDGTFVYGKLGFRRQFFEIGETRFAVDYGRFNRVAQNGDEATTAGVQIVQDFAEHGAEYYLGYRWHSLDRDQGASPDFDDINALMTGVRVKF